MRLGAASRQCKRTVLTDLVFSDGLMEEESPLDELVIRFGGANPRFRGSDGGGGGTPFIGGGGGGGGPPDSMGGGGGGGGGGGPPPFIIGGGGGGGPPFNPLFMDIILTSS